MSEPLKAAAQPYSDWAWPPRETAAPVSTTGPAREDRARALQRLRGLTTLVAAAAIWAGLASPLYARCNVVATTLVIVGMPLAILPWGLAWARSRRTVGREACGSILGLGLAGLVLWLGVSEAGFLLRFQWSRPALEAFVARRAPAEADSYKPRWIGCVHVGGVRQVGGAVCLYVSNGVYHQIGIARLPELPRHEQRPYRLAPTLDPPWYYVSYE